GARLLVVHAAGAQQIAFESSQKRRVKLFTGLDHLVFSLPRLRRYRSEINARKTENAGNDHRKSSMKKVVTEIPSSSKIPTIVKSGCAASRIGKLRRRSRVIALRKRRCVLRITSQTKSIPATAVP